MVLLFGLGLGPGPGPWRTPWLPGWSYWLHVEVIGCLAVVKTAEELGISKVTAETDSMMLKMAIGVPTTPWLQREAWCMRSRRLQLQVFLCVSVSFCPRTCNRVGHELAAHGCACPPDSELVWDGVPLGLETLVAGDCTQGRSCPLLLGSADPDGFVETL